MKLIYEIGRPERDGTTRAPLPSVPAPSLTKVFTTDTKHRFLLGLDAGSSGVHCLLADADDRRSVSSFQAWFHPVDRGADVWGFQFDTVNNWRILARAVHDVIERAGAKPSEVIGLAAAGMRFGLVVLDKKGREIFATPNRDARAASQSSELARERGTDIQRLSGHWPGPIFTAPRLRWLSARQPDLLKRADKVLNVSDWVAFRLCGEAVMDHSQASETLLADLGTSDWASDMIDAFDLPRDIFLRVCPPGTPLGALTGEAASELGLKAGTPVAVGGADTQCGLLGGGVISHGQVGIVAGTTVPIQLVLDTPLIDATAHLWTGRHVSDKAWVLESNAGAMGEALEWISEALFSSGSAGTLNPVARLMGEAAESPPGAGGMISTFGTQVFNAKELSLPMGDIALSYLATGKNKARCSMARAVTEGMAYSVKANMEQLSQAAGTQPSEITLMGGVSRSPFWSQMLSDVLGRELRVASSPLSSALGAAICAGVAAELYASLEEGARELGGTGRRHTPDEKRVDVYGELYSSWQQIRKAQTEADEIAAGLSVRMIMEQSEQAGMRKRIGSPDFLPRILITADMDSHSLEAFNTMGEVEYAPFRKEMRVLSGPDLVDILKGFQVLVTEVDVVDSEAMLELKDLRVIGVCRGNPVNIDVNAATVAGIPVINTPGRNAFSVADLTVTFMLMLARKLPEAAAFLRQPGIEAGDSGRMGQAFVSLRGSELWRKTVGLIGMGAVGRAVTQRILQFGPRVLVYDPYVSCELAARYGAESVDLEALLENSDFVSLHCTVTDESERMLGAREFSLMKAGAFLINTARASLVDEAALANALKTGRLAGAAIDVFSVEPPGTDHPLLALPNVIATPHLGGNTAEVAAHQGGIIAEELRCLLKGETPRHVVNPETLPRFSWEGERIGPPKEVLEKLTATPPPAVSDLHQRDKAPEVGGGSMVNDKEAYSQGAGETDPTNDRHPGKRMQHIVERFVEGVLKDAEIRDFSKRRSVTMHFVMTDFGHEFYLGFRGGEVTGGVGKPEEKAEVLLKMKADILDGIFTGRLNPTRAALSGKISFTGDTVKAMAFQQIQKKLMRLYLRAREEVGDPGDLTLAAEPALNQTQRGDIRDEMLTALNEMYDAGVITSTGGNISVRLPSSRDEMYITPSQIFKGGLKSSMMVRIDSAGNQLDASSLSPSSERLMHCAIYRARPDVEAVIHSHAPQATMLALADLKFQPISTEAAFIGEIPRVPFIMPGTQELADAVAKAMKRGVAVLMQNHGLIVAGGSLRRAVDLTLIIEQTAEMIVTGRKLGRKLPVLPEESVKMLRQLDDLKA